MAILDHASRACLWLQRLSDKSPWSLLHELLQAVKRYGLPQYLRTDNEAVFVSRLFRLGLWLLRIRQQRIQPGCPWQNGRVERFIGTVKRELAANRIADGDDLPQVCDISVTGTTTNAHMIICKVGHHPRSGQV
ncbi:MAG TPA: integrase core domain-containing protein [Nitrospira sp.]|nr:integrase core domain-containing protein [Nitrospira sp.]